MRGLRSFLSALVFAVILTARGHSQAPALEKSPRERLQEMKEQNQRLLEKQTVTLEKLEQMAKEAEQLKFTTKRS